MAMNLVRIVKKIEEVVQNSNITPKISNADTYYSAILLLLKVDR